MWKIYFTLVILLLFYDCCFTLFYYCYFTPCCEEYNSEKLKGFCFSRIILRKNIINGFFSVLCMRKIIKYYMWKIYFTIVILLLFYYCYFTLFHYCYFTPCCEEYNTEKLKGFCFSRIILRKKYN